ncbi:hypothetical protein F5883DRAFT_129817 [Diaporthe sp. PMI_573]|nr:hypothetical protein F5883DRAFT_129817 [Diaporthaceae sp. PMI_573]
MLCCTQLFSPMRTVGMLNKHNSSFRPIPAGSLLPRRFLLPRGCVQPAPASDPYLRLCFDTHHSRSRKGECVVFWSMPDSLLLVELYGCIIVLVGMAWSRVLTSSDASEADETGPHPTIYLPWVCPSKQITTGSQGKHANAARHANLYVARRLQQSDISS